MKIQSFLFLRLSPEYPGIVPVLSSSVGEATPEKMNQVIQSYHQPYQKLVGAFKKKELGGVVGFEFKDELMVIRHLSVIAPLRKQGMARALIKYLILSYHPFKVRVETDEESVHFYQKIEFIASAFKGPFGIRYQCYWIG